MLAVSGALRKATPGRTITRLLRMGGWVIFWVLRVAHCALYTRHERSFPPGAASFDRRPGALGAGPPLFSEEPRSQCHERRG